MQHHAMSTPTFRSLFCPRARPELYKTGQALRSYFRDFSTTQSLADDAIPTGNNSRSNNASSTRGRGGTARERGRAAASAINSMVRNRGLSPNSARPAGTATGAAGAGSGAPKVLDVRSLPRGLGRGRGGAPGGSFRGRGDFAAGAGGRGTNRFAQAAGGRGGRGRGGGARGGTRGGARGRGGAATREGRRDGAQAGERAPRRERDTDPFERMDDAEQAFDAAIRFGTSRPYNPTLNVADILTHAPAVPTSTAGRRAAVMESLKAIGGGTGDAVGAANNFIPNAVEGRVADNGLAFFATLDSRGWAEEHIQQRTSEASTAADASAKADVRPVFSTVDKTVQQVVFDAAVAGKHEAPVFSSDVHGIVRSQQLRTVGYNSDAMASFQAKLQSLVGAAKPAAPVAAKGSSKPAVAATGKETKKKAKEAKA